jgi:hypothetical protein
MVLNHYAINQIVGAQMVATKGQTRFGNFGLLNVVGNLVKSRPRPAVKVSFDLEADRLILQAFSDVSDGASTEGVIIDSSLASKFHSAARKLGVHASAADMNRRLFNIRKNPARYKRHGLEIPKATKSLPHPSIVPRYAHVIEFALTRLRYRYGATIDDILIDPALGAEYEQMAAMAAPGLSSMELRLAALYIRKTRYIPKNSEGLIESLNTRKIDAAFENLGAINQLTRKNLKEEEGLIEVLENDKYLYISRSADVRSAVDQISSDTTLKFMANDFWHPRPEKLSVRVLSVSRFLDVPISQWQLKLIGEKKPVFNYPIAA